MSFRRVADLGSTTSILFLMLVFCAGFLLVPTSHASVGFQPVNADELKMTSEPMAPGAPAIILYHEVNRDDLGRLAHGGVQVSYYNASSRYEEDYFRIKILTEEGRKHAEIEIPMLKSYIIISGVHARTIRPDGSIVEFTGQVFEKTISKKKGVKYDAKTFTLPDVQVGSIIEYYYTVNYEGGYIWFSNWILSNELFQKHARFTLRPYNVEGSHINLRWSERLAPGMPEPKQGPDGIVKLEADNIPAFQSEDFMPPENELKARIDFIYSWEAFEPDLNKYWKQAGKKRNEEVQGFLSKRGALEGEVARILSPSDSPEVKLQKIYTRVQGFRNLSYEPAKTDEEKKREHERDQANAEDVLKRGYGNENQLNWLFLGLARAAGLEAYGLALSDRSEFFFNPQMMDSNRLNQTAVLVKLNGKDLYFDPGSRFAPFGMLKWEETGVQGLRLDKDGGAWIQTVVPDSSLSQIQRRAELKIADNGDLEGKLTVTFSGLESLRRRFDERSEDEVERKKYLEEEVQQYIPAASEVKLVNTPEWGSTAAPLVAEFNLKVPGWVSRGGKLALCPVGLFGGTERHVFDHAERIHPIYFEFPAQRVDDVLLELPTGWRVSTLPKAQNQDYHVVAYSMGAQDNKTSFRLTRKLDINIVSMDTKYYGPIRSFFQGVRDVDGQQVVLQPGAAVSSN